MSIRVINSEEEKLANELDNECKVGSTNSDMIEHDRIYKTVDKKLERLYP